MGLCGGLADSCAVVLLLQYDDWEDAEGGDAEIAAWGDETRQCRPRAAGQVVTENVVSRMMLLAEVTVACPAVIIDEFVDELLGLSAKQHRERESLVTAWLRRQLSDPLS